MTQVESYFLVVSRIVSMLILMVGGILISGVLYVYTTYLRYLNKRYEINKKIKEIKKQKI